MTAAEASPEIGRRATPVEVAFEAAELEAFLEDVLRVCAPGPILVLGCGAERVVKALLHRGIDAYGLSADGEALNGRCRLLPSTEIPFETDRFESALVLGAFDILSQEELALALGELRRTVKGAALLVTSRMESALGEKPAGEVREWWEKQCIAAGFRKHPGRSWFNPYDSLDCEHRELVMAFERVDASADSVAGVEIFDAAREPGMLSDALLARYETAAAYIRPWDVVVDLGCDSGFGTHLLRRCSRGGRFIGIDAHAEAVAYAQAHYGSKTTEFRHGAPLQTLRGMADNSVHFIFCADERMDVSVQSKECLDELLRVLVPGGRVLLATTEPLISEGEDSLLQSAPERFLLEKVYQLTMRHASDNEGGRTPTARLLRAVAPKTASKMEADWRLVLLMKDPVRAEVPAYEETVFGNLNGCDHVSVAYAEHYRNPFILHALMHASFRVTAPQWQAECAARIVAEEEPASADAGAGLCLLLYRMADSALPGELSETDILERVHRYFAIASPNPMQRRWQVSLSSALGMFHLRRGEFAEAKAAFETCARFDPFVHLALAAKPVEAWFWLGWLALSEGDLEQAEAMWTKGLQFGDQIVGRGLVETLMQPSWPNLFDWGDGMRELTATLESVTQCANGLHCLRLQRQGVSFRWDLITNTFRAQRDNREKLLRQAQYRVGKLCRDIETLTQQTQRQAAELATLRREKETKEEKKQSETRAIVLAPALFNQTGNQPQKAQTHA